MHHRHATVLTANDEKETFFMEIDLCQFIDQVRLTWVIFVLTKMGALVIKKDEAIEDLKRQLRAEKAKTWWNKLLRG
jgi:hypothetical protein